MDHWLNWYETYWRLNQIVRNGDREKKTDLGDVWGGFAMLVDRLRVTDNR